MKSDKAGWLKVILMSVIFVACIAIALMQVYTSRNATKLESSLFSVLQFLLAIGFTWLVALVSFETQYKERQKKFAIGAFRRVKEIERNIVRTSRHVRQYLHEEDEDNSCLQVVEANLASAKDTITSSISDWADIIEDEIEISKQIELLESTQVSQVEEGSSTATEDEILKLLDKLPPSIRQIMRRGGREDDLDNAISSLRSISKAKNGLYLKAFWEPGDGLMHDLEGIKEGDEVYVARGITNRRTGAVLVYDAEGKSIGVVTNPCSQPNCGYDTFAEAVDRIYGSPLRPKLFGGTPARAKVTVIRPYSGKSGRRYFEVQVSEAIEENS